MSDEKRRRFLFAGYLVAGLLAAAITGLIAPRGEFARWDLFLQCLAVGFSGALVWTSIRTRNLFPALLLVIVVPAFSELFGNPATRPAAFATAVRLLLPVAAYLGAALACRTARQRFLCGLASLTALLAVAHTTGSIVSSLLLHQDIVVCWQSPLAGLLLGMLSGLLFGLVDFLQARLTRAGLNAS
ncbi:MAG: hypothetical protein R6X14_05120 [bacterium]